MLQKIKNFMNNYYLKESEKKWVLYDGIVETDINWEFTFIDQFKTGGHFNSQLVRDNEKQVCNSVIIINLNKRLTEEVLFHHLNHEALHVAICDCIANQNSDFIETVIEDWILEERAECKGWEGDLYIKKRPQK